MIKILSIIFLFAGCHTIGQQSGGKTITGCSRSITDIEGTAIVVPDSIKRAACIDVLAYEIFITLGEEDKIVAMQTNSARAPWVSKVRSLECIRLLSSTPVIEDLLRDRIDIVIGGYGGPVESERMRSAGIVQVKAQPMGRACKNEDEFIASQKQMIKIYADILGSEANTRAEDWCKWYDEKIRYVRARVSSIPVNRRPKCYFARGPSPLMTHRAGGASATYWYGELAGAYMVIKDSPKKEMGNIGNVSIEEIIRLDPEYIFIGRQYPVSLITVDPRWKDITAVKTGKLIEIPGGVFYWDGGPESALLMLYFAWKLYPDLFADLDLKEEVTSYYKRFYNCILSSDEAERLLNGLSSDGSRQNPWGT